MSLILEVAAGSMASALAAQEGGAARVELCCALQLGGLTPSHATIALARERLRIPLYVLVRPRAGDFLYDDQEYGIMRRDVQTCGSLGCDGVVIGMLDAAGKVDVPRCRELVAAAQGMGVTFHRAFDCARDPHGALQDIMGLGCERVLTSGQRQTALQGAVLIRELIERARDRIAIMPGAGITSRNIAELAAATGASEFHASATRRVWDRIGHHSAPDGMGKVDSHSDVDEIRAMLRVLQTRTAPEGHER